MDFRTQVVAAGAASRVACDALLVLVGGDALPAGLDEALSVAIKDALRDGDLALKAGKSLYLHRVAGVKARRLSFVWAADSGVVTSPFPITGVRRTAATTRPSGATSMASTSSRSAPSCAARSTTPISASWCRPLGCPAGRWSYCS